MKKMTFSRIASFVPVCMLACCLSMSSFDGASSVTVEDGSVPQRVEAEKNDGGRLTGTNKDPGDPVLFNSKGVDDPVLGFAKETSLSSADIFSIGQ